MCADMVIKGDFWRVKVEKIGERVKKIKLYFETCDEYNVEDELLMTLSPREFSNLRACIREAIKNGFATFDAKFEAHIVVRKHPSFNRKIHEDHTFGKASRKKGLYGGFY